jgi:hypothetical protein
LGRFGNNEGAGHATGPFSMYKRGNEFQGRSEKR